MKKGIHPAVRLVVFRDVTAGWDCLIESTVKTKDTVVIDSVEYPLFKADVSSASHPAYDPGKANLIEKVGSNVSKFRKRYAGFAG